MHFLLIDTSTERGVIALGNQHEVLFSRELPFGSAQSKYLMPVLTEALHAFPFPPELKGIGVGVGPGSYTGIRLGVSVAQSLAYSWKVPLVGVSGLEGFVPSESFHQYAAILDARIGGVYLQKGEIDRESVLFKTEPQVLTLEQVRAVLGGVTHLVTPFAKSLQVKFKQAFPEVDWKWEERSPSVEALFVKVEELYAKGKMIIPPKQLDLLYLRQTEAERERERKKQRE